MSDNQGFVFYRLPQSQQIHHIYGKPILFDGTNSAEGFVFAPFDHNQKAWFFPSEATSLSFEKPYTLPLAEEEDPSKEKYCQYVELIKSHIREGTILKAVAARGTKVQLTSTLTPHKVFEALCSQYPGAFCYLVSSSQTGTWLGATPEQLVKIENQQLRTVALAGTQKKGAEAWSTKENEEQQLVLKDILEKLKHLKLRPQASQQQRIQAGNLVHLVNDIQATIEKGFDRRELLQLLHPTPAVGGLPKTEALSLIQSAENLNRRFYSGYLGPWNAKSCNLFVNLRCMEWGSDAIRLYAGAGIVAQSDAEAEWNETTEKMKTVGRFVSFHHN